jgi:hypothetical protein
MRRQTLNGRVDTQAWLVTFNATSVVGRFGALLSARHHGRRDDAVAGAIGAGRSRTPMAALAVTGMAG